MSIAGVGLGGRTPTSGGRSCFLLSEKGLRKTPVSCLYMVAECCMCATLRAARFLGMRHILEYNPGLYSSPMAYLVDRLCSSL